MIYNDLAVSTLYKHLLKSADRCRVLHSINLCAGHHTIANLSLREVKRILENLHLFTYFLITGGIIYTALDKVIQIDLRKLMSIDILIHADTNQTEQALRQQRSQAGYRIKHHIKQIGRYGKHGKQCIRIILEDRFRQELTCEEHNKC